MPDDANTFDRIFGRPDPAAPPTLPFTGAWERTVWEKLQERTGAGYFWDRFLYLFGAALEPLRACLDAWAFAVPQDGRERMIVGRNAYGALLVLENPNDFGPDSRIAVLDPVRVAYERQPQIDFVGLIGYSLPNGEPAAFLHRGVYDEWRRRSGRFLQEGHILGVKRPLAEGGAMTVDNFAEEEVVSYFERTGATHAGNKPAAPRPAQAKKPRTRKRK